MAFALRNQRVALDKIDLQPKGAFGLKDFSLKLAKPISAIAANHSEPPL
jgi:hypothetical protein